MSTNAQVPSAVRNALEINQALNVANVAIDTKAPAASPTFTTKSTFSFATASTAPVFNASKELVSSAVTATELNYVHGQTGTVRAGSYTATADDANDMDIVTGLDVVTFYNADVFRAGVKVTEDAVFSEATGTITIADGGATYSVTEGDIVKWFAVGTIS